MKSTQTTRHNHTFTIDETGICTIEAYDKISVPVMSSIAESVMTYIVQHGLPVGLLIDVRHNNLLSIVRLSNLLDSLTGLGVPVAVVFRTLDQKNVASLLHNTLAQKDRVAYFTDLARAAKHLQHGFAQNASIT